MPEKFCPPTELLDLQPLPLKALNWPQAESLLASLGLQQLNAIQTQTFSSLYHSNESLFLGAAVGTGKSVCALLAIFNTLMN